MKTFLTTLLVIIATLMISCQQNEITPSATEAAETDFIEKPTDFSQLKAPDIRNEYLVFDNWQHVRSYFYVVNRKEASDRRTYEAKLAFTSMQTAYEDFEVYSEASIETGYDLSLGELVQKYQGTLIFDREYDYDMDISSIIYSEVVNKHGWMQVADTLYGLTQKRKIKIIEPTESKMVTSRTLDKDNSEMGIWITLNDEPLKSYSRIVCKIMPVMGSGGVTDIFSNAWLYQDNNKPGGAHEWKQEVTFQANAESGPNGDFVTFVKMKYRRRGFLSAWYANKPDSYSVSGVSEIESTSGLFGNAPIFHPFINVTYAESGNSTQATWKEYIFADNSSFNPAYLLPSLPSDPTDYGHNWYVSCVTFDLDVTFEPNDVGDESI